MTSTPLVTVEKPKRRVFRAFFLAFLLASVGAGAWYYYALTKTAAMAHQRGRRGQRQQSPQQLLREAQHLRNNGLQRAVSGMRSLSVPTTQ